ncbi:MAG: hypothetical protein JWQ74_1699 [Marmoricola sp.]|nr:hypothetical protein [Marmoricola sp.]
MNWPIFWLITVADAEEICAECKWTARLEGTDPMLQAKG